MKFIWAFLECLLGLTILLGTFFIVGDTKIEHIRPEYRQAFWAYYFLSICFLVLQATGILLIVDSVKRGNK